MLINFEPSPWRCLLKGLTAGAILSTGACASYQPYPLSSSSELTPTVSPIEVNISNLVLPGIETHPFNPGDGLDMTEVATLAVFNNPDLKAQRQRKNVAQAMLFSAGLLPDPQLSVNLDHPTSNDPGLVTAWGLGLGYDLLPLITRSTRIEVEKAASRQVDLDLIWQEWQVAQQARNLYIQYLAEEQRLDLLQQSLQLYQHRYELSSQALKQGNLTLDVTGTDLTALIDTHSLINQQKLSHNDTRHILNLLLGLKSDVQLRLQSITPPESLDPEIARLRFLSIMDRRPDLLALKAGYASQEARVRQAVINQFPSLNVGFNGASDTSSVETIGFGVSLNLPLFSANRGAIAVERATREQLREEYKARLANTEIDIGRLLQLQDLIAEQQQKLAVYVPELEQMVKRASKAYEKQDINALIFLNMESTWINKRIEQLNLIEAQWKNRIALDTLLAWNGSLNHTTTIND